MKSFTEIDLGQLEKHWLKHPKRVEKYAALLADAKQELATVEAQMEVVEAETKLAIRRHPKKFGYVGKPTEGAVKELLVLAPEYQAALQSMHNAKHAVDVLTGTMTTLDHMKRTLENLVTLHGQGYFAKPKVHKSVDNGTRSTIESASFTRGRKMKHRRRPV